MVRRHTSKSSLGSIAHKTRRRRVQRGRPRRGRHARAPPLRPIPLTKRDISAFILAHGVRNPDIGDVLGRWDVNYSESVLSFEVRRSRSTTPCKLPCYHGGGRTFDGPVRFVCEVRGSDVQWRDGVPPSYLPADLNSIGYNIVVRANGVLTFVPFGNNVLGTLALARIDSNGWIDFMWNVYHGARHGCFCFAVLEKLRGGRFAIRRYNRWNDDVPSVYWTAVKRD